MKKIISLMLAVLMIASVSVVMASAASETATVTVYDIKGNAGDTVTYHVGDEFTAYLAINTSNLNEGRIGSLQGLQTYDSSVLEVTNAYSADDGTILDAASAFPIVYSGVVANAKNAGEIAFNASIAAFTGWQFNTDESMLIVINYKVIGTGSTEIKTTMRTLAMSDYNLTRIINKYQIVNDDFTTFATLSPAPATEGSTVSGTVTSYTTTSTSSTHTVTVQLIQNNEVKYETSTVGSNSFAYSISDVEDGDYTLRVSKPNHVTRDYAITVSGDTVQDAKICPLGDANQDGRVNGRDVAAIRNNSTGKVYITDSYAFSCADVNSDKRVNARDVSLVRAHLVGTKYIWTV